MVRYKSERLRKICTVERECRRALGVEAVKRLGARIKELETSKTIEELLDSPCGGWHVIHRDYPGCYSGKVTGGHRIIADPPTEDRSYFLVVAVGDVYKH